LVSYSFDDPKNLRSAIIYHAAIINSKRTYNSSLISSSSTIPRQLWKNINVLLHLSSSPALSSYDSLRFMFQLLANTSQTKFTSSIIVYFSIVFTFLLQGVNVLVIDFLRSANRFTVNLRLFHFI